MSPGRALSLHFINSTRSTQYTRSIQRYRYHERVHYTYLCSKTRSSFCSFNFLISYLWEKTRVNEYKQNFFDKYIPIRLRSFKDRHTPKSRGYCSTIWLKRQNGPNSQLTSKGTWEVWMNLKRFGRYLQKVGNKIKIVLFPCHHSNWLISNFVLCVYSFETSVPFSLVHVGFQPLWMLICIVFILVQYSWMYIFVILQESQNSNTTFLANKENTAFVFFYFVKKYSVRENKLLMTTCRIFFHFRFS